MLKYALTLMAAGLLLAADAKKDDAKKDQEAIQGTWKVLSVERGGKPQDDAKEFSMTYEKDTFTVKRGAELVVKGTFKLDPSKSPKAIDMKITEGRNEQDKGKDVHGIYELTKDGLKWCTAEPGSDDRPKEFATKEGTKHMLIAFEKGKP
jgi:uncharacterized protein (TIGR03067 family)